MSNGRLKTLHYSISRIPSSTGYKPRVADQRELAGEGDDAVLEQLEAVAHGEGEAGGAVGALLEVHRQDRVRRGGHAGALSPTREHIADPGHVLTLRERGGDDEDGEEEGKDR